MVLVGRCCRFIPLSAGSLAIGIFIVVTSLLGILYIFDLSDDDYWSFSEIILSDAMYGGVVTSSVLLIIGAVIIGGWIWKKYKIIKWACIALLIFSIIRIVIAFWRFAEGKSFGSFLIIFIVTLFYLYGCVVLWSFYQEERDLEIARSLPSYHPLNVSEQKKMTIDEPEASTSSH